MTKDENTYEKWVRNEVGQWVRRYKAIDPAQAEVRCTCGKEECHRPRLLPLREHIAELYAVLEKLHQGEMQAWEPSQWVTILYALRMSASIEDVEAYTGYVDDPLIFALCEPTIDYESAQSEMASKYVAATVIFSFLWQAYEATVADTEPTKFVKLVKERRYGERGRRILEARPEISKHFRGISDLVKLALLQCRKGGLMDARCERVDTEYGNRGLITAAELAREFRNFIFHGCDEVPMHEDWGDPIVSRCRIYRFYSVSRLILYLIQAMCWIKHEANRQFIKYGPDDDDLTPREILERLQFVGTGIWPPLTRERSSLEKE